MAKNPDNKGALASLPQIEKYASDNNVDSSILSAFKDYLENDNYYGLDEDGALQMFGNALNQINREVDYQRSLENRSHTEQYNAPTEQIARLMATGMSRQAAMSALQGGATTDTNSQPSGQQFSTNMAGNKANLINALGSLSSQFADIAMQASQFGLSVPAIKSNSALASTSAYLSQMQQDAYNMSGSFYAGIHKAILNGALNPKEFTSYDDMARLAYNLPDTPENHGLYEFMHGDGYARLLANPFAMDNQHSLFNSNWGMIDNANNVAHNARFRSLQEQALSINIQETNANLYNILADTDLLLQQLQLNEQLNPLLVEEQGLLNSNQSMQNYLLWQDVDIAKEVFSNVKQSAIYRTTGEMKRLAKLSSDEVISKELKAYCADKDNLYAVSTLGYIAANASVDFYKEHPELRTLINICEDLHVGEIVGKSVDLVGMLNIGRNSTSGIGKNSSRSVSPNTKAPLKTPKPNSKSRQYRLDNGTFYNF